MRNRKLIDKKGKKELKIKVRVKKSK